MWKVPRYPKSVDSLVRAPSAPATGDTSHQGQLAQQPELLPVSLHKEEQGFSTLTFSFLSQLFSKMVNLSKLIDEDLSDFISLSRF